MLDALKFAFEILIVGTLALPWLAILSRMFASAPAPGMLSYWSVLPKTAQGPVAVAAVIAFGYVAGSALSRASRDMFNDELLKPLPTEDSIRDAVYQDEYCGQDLIDMDEYLPFFEKSPPRDTFPLDNKSSLSVIHQKYRKQLKKAFCPNQDTPERLSAHIREMFSLQESELLLLGQDKVDRLKQYYDQINVLRGAALNGFILFMVCTFGCCGNLRLRRPYSRIVKVLALVPAGSLLLYGTWSLLGHFHDLLVRAQNLYGVDHPSLPEVLQRLYGDPPFAEIVFVLLGVVGLFVVATAKKTTPYFRTCLATAAITVVCFGGWWWTEVMYDFQVVHSQIELHPGATALAAPQAGGSASLNESENNKEK